MRGLLLLVTLLLGAGWGEANPTAERFRAATAAVRDGDTLAGIRAFRELAAEGVRSPSLYWNWAQAAAARGQRGEAMWALLRCRQLAPADRSVKRELERVRQAANLSPAELFPQPFAEIAFQARRWWVGSVAVALLVGSLLLHAAARWWFRVARWPVIGAWVGLGLGLLLTLPAGLAPKLARPLAVVVRSGTPLFDAASPQAGALTQLREGEVVPILSRSGPYLRIQDSSGARGWARVSEVWPLAELPQVEALR